MKLITKNVAETKKLGQKIAKEFIRNLKPSNQAIVLNLDGDLGGGKTTFVQGLANGLGIKKQILSPTFVLFKRYKLDDLPFNDFYHFDCYRLETKADINNLKEMHLKDIIRNPKNIVAIEWSERLKNLRPNGASFHFVFRSEKEREIKTEGIPCDINIKESE